MSPHAANVISPPTLKLLLTSRDAADALAVSESTFRRIVDRGEIPTVRVGRLVRFSVDALRQFIERQQSPAVKVHAPSGNQDALNPVSTEVG